MMKAIGCLFGLIIMALVFLVPYIEHIVWCINKADETGSAIALLVVGVVIFPVGWLHGLSLILGMGGWL